MKYHLNLFLVDEHVFTVHRSIVGWLNVIVVLRKIIFHTILNKTLPQNKFQNVIRFYISIYVYNLHISFYK